ncbi:MAG: aminoacyl-tRNA deacylase [Candidatus Nanohaloarchaea archaeon]
MKNFTQDLDEMKEITQFLEKDLDNIKRVVDFCEENQLDIEFEIHAKAETVDQSVQHSNISKDQIIKTLVFVGEEAYAVLCPGDKRVNEDKLGEIVDEEDLNLANPEEVEEYTGYVIGGVSPFDLDIPVCIEKELLNKDMVRPAAGSRLVGARIAPEKLKETIDADEVEIAE